jgi:DNA-binding CsgD family transcriptional regulator
MEIKTDINSSYKKGELVFDEQAHQFGRVLESRPGFLSVSLVRGGKLVREDIDKLDFVRQNRQKLTLPEMANRLFISELEVIALLNRLELEASDEMDHSALKDGGKSKSLKLKQKNKAIRPKKKPELKIARQNHGQKSNKPPIKMAAKGKSQPLKRSMAKEIPVNFTKLLPKGATTDPVMDPNGYIQQNFLLMSNRELAVATGLSEHTIRRKLGEWNLKRKDFVQRA